MNVQYLDGRRESTMDPKLADFFRAAADPTVKSVAIHNAPPAGAIVCGRIVTDENRPNLYLTNKARWQWRNE